MEAIRKIVTVKDNKVSVVLPSHLNNQEVEVIVLATGKSYSIDAQKPDYVQEPESTYGEDLYGTVKLGMTIEEIDASLKLLRSEWERDIS